MQKTKPSLGQDYTYKTVVHHGESGTVYYLVKIPTDSPDDWEVVDSSITPKPGWNKD